MIAFKKMWDDVCVILSNEDIDGLHIVDKFKNGFVVRENEDTEFITKDDFVDFWCKMLCTKQISKEQLLREDKAKLKYVYDIVKMLPYITESSGVLKLNQ